MEDHDLPEKPGLPTPTLAQLFLVFGQVGVVGFGGAMAMARRLIIERHKWLSETEFTDLLGISQFLPGAMIVNLAVAIGRSMHGWRGAFVAVTGLLWAPLLIVVIAAALYDRVAGEPAVQRFLAGLSAAAIGLLLATAAKMARPHLRNRASLVAMTLSFGAVAIAKLPLLVVLCMMTPVSIFLKRIMVRQ